MAPDIIIDVIVKTDISAYKIIYTTSTTHRIIIEAICDCESFFLAIE